MSISSSNEEANSILMQSKFRTSFHDISKSRKSIGLLKSVVAVNNSNDQTRKQSLSMHGHNRANDENVNTSNNANNNRLSQHGLKMSNANGNANGQEKIEKSKYHTNRSRLSIKFGENVSLEALDSNGPILDEENHETLAEKQKKILNSYKTIVQLSTENKITKSNAWNLNLIENIHSVLATLKGSFPKAGSTLEASVDIYEKRVDSIHSDTYKIFENVNRGGNANSNSNNNDDVDGQTSKKSKKNGDGYDDDDNNDETCDDDDGDGKSGNDKQNGKGKKKIHTVNGINTIEQNLSKLNLTIDREFDIDPLFRKMSKAFDEGGARGMLLNVLGVHSGCGLVFDTSAAVAFPKKQESTNLTNQKSLSNQNDLMDSSKLLGTFSRHSLPSSLCPSLSTLRGELDEGANPMQNVSATESSNMDSEESPYDAYYDGGGGDDGGYYDNDDYGSEGNNDHYHNSSSSSAAYQNHSGSCNSFSTSKQSVDVELIIAHKNNEYSYFDPAKVELRGGAWAGATHWRFNQSKNSKSDKSKGAIGDSSIASKSQRASASSRKSKKPKEIDFFSSNQESKSLFAKAKSSKLIQLSSSSCYEDMDINMGNKFPVDLHYDSRYLRQLFLKPDMFLSRSSKGNLSLNHHSAEPSYTYNNNNDGSMDYDDGGGDGGGGYYDDDDDEDGVGGYGMNAPVSQPVSVQPDTRNGSNNKVELVAASRKIEKIEINFATRAKKVDVKKLKTTLWSHIESHAPFASAMALLELDKKENDSDDEQEAILHSRETRRTRNQSEQQSKPTQSQEEQLNALSFKDTVNTLAPSLASNITVPFYFICALHLANEKGLRFVTQPDMKDFAILREPSSAIAQEHASSTVQLNTQPPTENQPIETISASVPSSMPEQADISPKRKQAKSKKQGKINSDDDDEEDEDDYRYGRDDDDDFDDGYKENKSKFINTSRRSIKKARTSAKYNAADIDLYDIS